MKRVIAIVLVMILALSCLAACGGTKEGTCELCQKEATLSKVTYEGEEGWFCAECEKSIDALADLADAIS